MIFSFFIGMTINVLNCIYHMNIQGGLSKCTIYTLYFQHTFFSGGNDSMLLQNSEYGQLQFRGKSFDPTIIGLKKVGN